MTFDLEFVTMLFGIVDDIGHKQIPEVASRNVSHADARHKIVDGRRPLRRDNG
jgi:hypothetical protein